MKKNMILTIGITLLALLVAANAMAGCTVYKNKKYLGSSKEMTAGEEISSFDRKWDNTISSAKVTPGCELTVWKDSDFQGKTKTFTENARTVGNQINDMISSAKCTCQD